MDAFDRANSIKTLKYLGLGAVLLAAIVTGSGCGGVRTEPTIETAATPQVVDMAARSPTAAATAAGGPSSTPLPLPSLTATATMAPIATPTAFPTIEEPTPVPLAEAVAQKLADIQILGMGGASGASIQIVVSVIEGRYALIAVEPGTVLRSSVPGEQDMVVRRLLGVRQGEQRYLPAEIIAMPGFSTEPKTWVVDAYCLDFHKDNPSPTTSLAVDAASPASPAVAAVLAAAGRVPGAERDIAAIQAAVWMITDRPTWQDMADRGYTPNREMVAALLQSAGLDQACAQLFGQACTVPDCSASNPTGQGGTRGGPCVSRLPGVTLPAPTAAPTQAVAAAATRAVAPTRAATQPKPAPAPTAVCPDARVCITYPANGATISGVTNFLGTANVPDQAYYKFEYKPASSPTWQYLTQFEGKTVVEDKLMDFYTTTIAPGVYDFRLIAVDRSGNYPAPCEIRLTVQR